MATRPKMIKVSHASRHRSQHHHSLKKKRKRSKNIIHVSLKSSQDIQSHNSLSFTNRTNPSFFSLKHDVKNSFTTQNSVNKPTTIASLSVRQHIGEHEDSYTDTTDKQRSAHSDQQSNHKRKLFIQSHPTNTIQDHHRKKKKKKNRRCLCIFLCVCLLAVLLVCIVIATTLGILLSKKSTKITKITPSINATLRWNSTGITIAGVVAVSGANASLLRLPYGMAFDSSNNLYIADYNNHRIQKLITGTSTTVTVAGSTNGTSGTAMDRLYLPVDILFDSNDNMYITDRGNNRVQFWMKGATSGTSVAGINGTFNISLFHPSAILADPDSGSIFIADTFNHRIVSYPTVAVVAGGNGPGNNDTTLYDPYGLVYESVSKSFVIPNYDTNNIVRWALGATKRTLIAGDALGNSGSNSTLLWLPVGITMDPMGNIYVADSNNHRIQFFMAGQSNATTIAGTGAAGTSANQLNIPFWVILDNQLNLYVADTFNNRVQKFLRY